MFPKTDTKCMCW